MPPPRKPKKVTRRARGTGSIFYHAGRKKWVGRALVGKTADGKPCYVERSAATQKELLEKLAAAGPPGPETTVAEWAARWLDGLSVRPATRRGYTNTIVNHVVPELGHVRLRDLTTYHVEAAAKKWSQGNAPGSVRSWVAHLNTCLRAAVRAKAVATNPATDASRPKVPRKRLQVYTPAELAAIIAEAAKQPHTRGIALIAGTGCRVGECLALEVPDYDPAAGTVSITKTLPDHRSLPTGPPKTENGVRTIEVPASVRNVIVAAIGRRVRGPLFTTQNGTRINRNNLGQTLRAMLRRLGLVARGPHHLRHSIATALISAGWPPGDVADYLGDTVQTIVETYLHPTGRSPVRVIESLLSGDKVDGAANAAKQVVTV